IEAEVAALEVEKELAKVPTSLRTPRPKPTPTKETGKNKKGKQPSIPVCTSP
ncbi:Hypothetical predicted protein, partial [Olea europaea subsp. europaea]